MMSEKSVTIDRAGLFLGNVSRRTIYNMLHDGRLTGVEAISSNGYKYGQRVTLDSIRVQASILGIRLPDNIGIVIVNSEPPPLPPEPKVVRKDRKKKIDTLVYRPPIMQAPLHDPEDQMPEIPHTTFLGKPSYTVSEAARELAVPESRIQILVDVGRFKLNAEGKILSDQLREYYAQFLSP